MYTYLSTSQICTIFYLITSYVHTYLFTKNNFGTYLGDGCCQVTAPIFFAKDGEIVGKKNTNPAGWTFWVKTSQLWHLDPRHPTTTLGNNMRNISWAYYFQEHEPICHDWLLLFNVHICNMLCCFFYMNNLCLRAKVTKIGQCLQFKQSFQINY